MNNRFTEKAQNVLAYANENAMDMGHDYVGSEHLLLGLMEETEGLGSQLLSQAGVTTEKIKDQLSKLISIGEPTDIEPRGLTPRTKRILEMSLMEASRLNTPYIDSEHILLAMLREGESIGVQVLRQLGVDIRRLYSDLVNSLNSRQMQGGEAPSGRKGQKANTPTLDKFGRDLTAMAAEGKIDEVIGREKEVERVIQILSRRNKNNPCLIGEPGVGKTAIAEGLALKIVKGQVPEFLRDKKIVTLELGSMIAGAKYRGEFEDRLKNAMEEIKKAGNIILFIDEIHTIVGAGAAEGAIDAANILKPTLARGEFRVIGATTLNEYRKYIEKDAALERRFQPVMVDEPSQEEAIQILMGIRDKYEAHHNVKISDEAVTEAVKMSSRYITDRFLPDKAIDLIDEAASRIRLHTFTAPPDLKELEDKVAALEKEKKAAVNSQDFEKAAKLRDEEKKVQEELKHQKEEWEKQNSTKNLTVTKEDIATIISSWTGIPVNTINEDEKQRVLHLDEEIKRRVIGQDMAVEAVAKAIKRSRVGLKDPKRPIGSFIFLGPTGVGKTELSKALSQALFGDDDAMIRIDMSEYMEKHSVSKIIGSPPGYVGYDEGGQLTERLRKKPYSVVLFDEIEKAHPDVFNILLQMLDDGHITDAQGRKIDMKNTVIIMTSNVGARTITDSQKLGFATTEDKEKSYEKTKEEVMQELKRTFRPEFLNRIDDIIVFNQLTKDNIRVIAKNLLKEVQKRLAEREITVDFTDSAIDFLTEKGFDPVYGARPLKRAILTYAEDMLAEKMLDGTINEGDHVEVTREENGLVAKKVTEETKEEPAKAEEE
jgi:ATP-dependent Clp protease ATP-binding subunit ClpC